MNNQNKHRPGMICRAVRQWEALRGPASGHTRVTERHLEVCDACQEFFADDSSFEDLMRSSARVERRAAEVLPAVGFEQRILRAVRESQPRPEARPARSLSIGLAMAGAVAGIALALALTQRPTKQPGPDLVRSQPSKEIPVEGQAVAEVATSAIRWLGALEPGRSAVELVEKNPLQQEIESVSVDAKSVIDFLALNFLPSDSAPKTHSSDGSRQG